MFIYIYKDFEKVKSWTFGFEDIHHTILLYKKHGKAGDLVSEVQSVLCEEMGCLKRVYSRIFIRLFILQYKKHGKACDLVSEVQSALCEEVVCLKRVIMA